MPEARLERTRQAYKEERKSIKYYPCDRYTMHNFTEDSDTCLWCGRTKLEIKLGPIQEVEGY